MRKIYNLESFEKELSKRFPKNHIKILEFSGTAKPCSYQCLRCGKIYTKKKANHLYENKTLCQKCFSAKDSKMRDWILSFFEETKDFELVSWNNNTASNLRIKCKTCGREFKKSAANIYKKDKETICPYCGNNGFPVLKEDFLKEMKEEGKIDYEIIEYSAKKNPVVLRHKCGYTFSQLGFNFLKSKGCPLCYKNKYKGEEKIKGWLIEHSIAFEEQKRFKNQEIGNCSYDFFLPEQKILIEFQGEQHYYPIIFFGGQQGFETQKKNDKRKLEYAIKNNYKILYIPYYSLEKIPSLLSFLLGSTTILHGVDSSETKQKT